MRIKTASIFCQTAIGELFKHLNDKYKADTKLNEEVSDMIKSLYDERIFIRGIEQGEEDGAYKKAIEMAKEMLLDDEPITKIMKYTKLTEEKIKEIEKTI